MQHSTLKYIILSRFLKLFTNEMLAISIHRQLHACSHSVLQLKKDWPINHRLPTVTHLIMQWTQYRLTKNEKATSFQVILILGSKFTVAVTVGDASSVFPPIPACFLTLTSKAGKQCGHYSGSNINKYIHNELTMPVVSVSVCVPYFRDITTYVQHMLTQEQIQ
jgi:hypothetical protein